MNKHPNKDTIRIGFFGTSDYSVMTLRSLADAGHEIAFVVTMPDKPKGRGLELAAPPVKAWAIRNDIPVLQPVSLRPGLSGDDDDLIERLKSYDCDVFIVIAYGKIIPEAILDIPPAKSLNIHASLLPKYRGSCPIETAILDDEKRTGISIIRMDAKMDEGPIVAEKEIVYEPWPPTAEELGKRLVTEGAELLVRMLPDWIAGKISEREQDHSKATYARKILKQDGLIDRDDLKEPANAYPIFRKIQAYHEWPGCYFFIEKNGKKLRVKITTALFKDGKLMIEKVIPESGKEMAYSDFLKRYG